MKLQGASLPKNLDYTKPQVDQFVRANKENIKSVGIVGLITILAAVVKMIENYNNNKHEEKLAQMEHEEKMMELEIKLKKLEKGGN